MLRSYEQSRRLWDLSSEEPQDAAWGSPNCLLALGLRFNAGTPRTDWRPVLL